MTLHTIEALVYLKNYDMFRVVIVVDNNTTERELLNKIFEKCNRRELINLHRISCCQYLNDSENVDDVIPILRLNSRYWFDTPDERDAQYVEMRNQYLSSLI